MTTVDQNSKNSEKLPLRVLLVDDEHAILRVLERSLRRFHTTSVDRVELAQRLVKTGQFDVVISDNSMPGKTGVDLLTFVAEHAPRVRRIMHSGGKPEELDDLKAAGVIETFVAKPGYNTLVEHCEAIVNESDER